MLRAYLARRLIATIPVLFGVSVVIFLLMHLAPGDVTTVLLGPQATEQDRMTLRHTLGLDLPLPIQYGRWLVRTVVGDFGTSIATSLPVLQLILPRFVNTIILTVGKPLPRHRRRLRPGLSLRAPRSLAA